MVFRDNVLKFGGSLRQLETLSQANSDYKIVIITSTASVYRENSYLLLGKVKRLTTSHDSVMFTFEVLWLLCAVFNKI